MSINFFNNFYWQNYCFWASFDWFIFLSINFFNNLYWQNYCSWITSKEKHRYVWGPPVRQFFQSYRIKTIIPFLQSQIQARISNNFVVKNSVPQWVSCWNCLAAATASNLLLHLLDFKSVDNSPRYLIYILTKAIFQRTQSRNSKFLASAMQLWTRCRLSANCTNNCELLIANKS